jgi:hypothetical protein
MEDQMKNRVTTIGLSILSILLFCSALHAQAWDFIDVPQGYETLNLAVEGDTTAAGAPKSLNRVYRLARGGVYLINGHLVNVKGSPLRIWAAEGDGAKPLIIMAVNESGANDDFAYLEGPAHFKNLYISGIDMIGNQCRYTMAVYGNGTRVIWEGIQIDQSRQSHIRSYGTEQKLYFFDCEFRNSIDLATPSNGRFYDARGQLGDSLVLKNCTLYLNSQRMLRMDGAIMKNVIIDHVTFYQNAFGSNTSTGAKQTGPLELGKSVNATITNSLFIDLAAEAMRHRKTVTPPDRIPIISVDSIKSDAFPEALRKWLVANNAYGWSPELKTFWSTIDTVKGPDFISPYGKSAFFNGQNANFIEYNNFEELVPFADAPKPEPFIAYVKYRFSSNFNNKNNPDPRADRNGIGTLNDQPGSFGPENDRYTFDYPATAKAYTAGDKGYPLGDLNWFPAKKAQWLTEQATGVAGGSGATPTDYTLEQNHPNPFNPSTEIRYALAKNAKITITVHNALGQVVATLVQNQLQTAGQHSVIWNGRDSATGSILASGVYYYQLRSEQVTLTRKMLLIK